MSVFKIRLSLLVFLLLPVLLSLGFWQLSRYEQKLELEETWTNRQSQPPQPISALTSYDDPLYLPLKVSGRFIQDKSFFLDNQVFNGQAGYDLITPFILDSGQWLLVNRGWVSSISRDVLPRALIDKGYYQLVGTVYRPLGKPFLLKDDVWASDWPKRIQAVDFEKMAEAMSHNILPVLLSLHHGQPGALQIRPLKTPVSSDKHLGYAFQWFLMATVLMGLYLFHMKKRGK